MSLFWIVSRSFLFLHTLAFLLHFSRGLSQFQISSWLLSVFLIFWFLLLWYRVYIFFCLWKWIMIPSPPSCGGCWWCYSFWGFFFTAFTMIQLLFSLADLFNVCWSVHQWFPSLLGHSRLLYWLCPMLVQCLFLSFSQLSLLISHGRLLWSSCLVYLTTNADETED